MTTSQNPPVLDKVATVVEREVERDFDWEVTRLARKYNVDEQVVQKIIRCESGKIVTARNTATSVGTDIGYFQLNSYYHEGRAAAMGLDIYDPWDNLEYGFWLLSREGTQPWSASRHCHGY